MVFYLQVGEPERELTIGNSTIGKEINIFLLVLKLSFFSRKGLDSLDNVQVTTIFKYSHSETLKSKKKIDNFNENTEENYFE